MTTVELKNILMHGIAGINDKTFLTAIKTIIDTKSKTTIYKTTSEQRLKIKEGREQIDKGEFYTNEQVESEIDKWLQEK
jgi:predicted transcriptional regulator